MIHVCITVDCGRYTRYKTRTRTEMVDRYVLGTYVGWDLRCRSCAWVPVGW